MKTFLAQKNKGPARTLKLVSGFTLVETMVALSVFTLAILSLFAVLASGIKDTDYAKNKIIATYLAEEGVEYVRNMRDTYVFYSGVSPVTSWTDFKDKFLNNGCATTLGCYFNSERNADDTGSYNMYDNANQPRQVTKILVKGCTGVAPTNYTSCEELHYQTDGVYNYEDTATDTLSGFRRKITIEDINSNEIKVTSTVYWTKGSAVYNVSFTDNLFDLE